MAISWAKPTSNISLSTKKNHSCIQWTFRISRMYLLDVIYLRVTDRTYLDDYHKTKTNVLDKLTYTSCKQNCFLRSYDSFLLYIRRGRSTRKSIIKWGYIVFLKYCCLISYERISLKPTQTLLFPHTSFHKSWGNESLNDKHCSSKLTIVY